MNLKPGDKIFIVMRDHFIYTNGIHTGRSSIAQIVETVVWRHAGYLVAGHYWPTYRLVLTPENEGVEWSLPDDRLHAALKTAVALSANLE